MATYSAAKGDRGGARQATSGFLYVVCQQKGNPGQYKGVFNSYQREIIAGNRKWLNELRDETLSNMASRIKRPDVTTGRLLAATADPRNEKFDHTIRSYGFGFGNPAWLAQSQAKYWRTIEQGSLRVWRHPFTGTVLPMGRWGGSIEDFYTNRWGSQPLAGPPFTAPGRGGGGKLRPFGQTLRDRLGDGGKRSVVKHEIEPMNAYADAWRKAGAGRRIVDVWKQAFGGSLPSRRQVAANTLTRGGPDF